jgi:putative hemolysin
MGAVGTGPHGDDAAMARNDNMFSNRESARDISYAQSARTRGGRAVIRALENSTGRKRLIRQARGYDDEVRGGRSLWQVLVDRYGLSLEIAGGALTNIPATGPVIIIANHPYGLLDGLMLGHILAATRGDFRILAHSIFRKAKGLEKAVLPVSFEETKAAVALNIRTRRSALHYLSDGGAIGVFPGGTVSTAARPFGRPMDPCWRGFTARMIAKSDATVVPIFFDGQTSRLFQVASHLHANLRLGLLIKEFRKRVNTPVRVVIGDPIPRTVLDGHAKDSRAMMDFLRQATYDLSPTPLNPAEIGFEFEKKA